MKKILIANRGEIACRIMRSAKQRGLATVAVYSIADAQAQHVVQADEAVCIGPPAASESYLLIDRIISAAQQTGADAIHPGYGFLSENPDLVDACTQAGIVFVGPTAAAMRAMGLKDAAKRLMSEAGVPVVPGYHGEAQDENRLAAEASNIGYPVLIKARAGGGGKGMRQVHKPEDFAGALQAAQRESQASFGDAHVLIEKYITQPRHIEVQVFGDTHGNVVHLFERDCSLQRRHQKVIEEAPAPGMTEVVRAAMTEAAVTAAKAIDYVGAGTIEFIVDGSEGLRQDGFWFMEMNTRLQVEHPVTEAVTGVDLVDWQLRVAAGEPLPLSQSDLTLAGHSVEARIYAENPVSGFLPAIGRLNRWQMSTQGRVDSGVVQGDEVLPHYDPLLAKMIAYGPDRVSAFRQLSQQLADSCILGTTTNREFLWRLVSHEQVIAGTFDTSFIETRLAELVQATGLRELLAAACLEWVEPWSCNPGSVPRRLGNWQLWVAPTRVLRLQHDEQTHTYRLTHITEGELSGAWVIHSDDCPILEGKTITVKRLSQHRLQVDGIDHRVDSVFAENVLAVQVGACAANFALPVPGLTGSGGAVADVIISPMPGKVVAVHCVQGDRVKAGQPLLCVEAMKMEQDLCSPRDGVVALIGVQVGDQVSEGLELLRLVEQT